MPCAYTEQYWCQKFQTGQVTNCPGYTCNLFCPTVHCPITQNTNALFICLCGVITRRCEVATGFCR